MVARWGTLMTAAQLAAYAQKHAAYYAGALSADVIRQVAHGTCATWLTVQDNPARALATFEDAMTILRGSV